MMPEQYIAKPITAQQMLDAISKARSKYSDKLIGELSLSTDTITSYTISERAKGAYELYDIVLDDLSKLLNS